MPAPNFAPAAPDEQIVFGAARPAYPSDSPTAQDIDDWIASMQSHGIERVCCLLDDKLSLYDRLLDRYRTAFSPDHVLHSPLTDYHVVSSHQFHHEIRPFLNHADHRSQPVVVHCSAGSGRTGHILALWLATTRDYDLQQAIKTVSQTGRNPLEAATLPQLQSISAPSQ